ncbi:hypothetical protein H8959_014600 [Pygathrix nigripes]
MIAVIVWRKIDKTGEVFKGASENAWVPHHMGPTGDDRAFLEFGSGSLVTLLKIQKLLSPYWLSPQ